VEAGVDVGAVSEAHPSQQGAARLPGRPALAGGVPGLRELLASSARGAPAMARLRGQGVAGGGQPGPCGGVRDPLELLRVYDLASVRSLRAS
jgi:hypothetical protein